jgi:integrase
VLRHTFASRLLQNAIDIVTVSKLLGHSSIQTTMRYLHLAKTAMREAVNVVSVTQFGTSTRTTTKPIELVEKIAG